MAVLPAQGEISYNNFTFGPESETIGVSIKPILDVARRTVITNQYEFVIKSTIALTKAQTDAGATDLDVTLDSIRSKLTQSGCKFVYSGKGFGDIQINTDQIDMNWGPIPEELSWKPVGGNYAGEIIWKVSFQTLDCNGAEFTFGIMAFNYTVEFTQGHDRMTNRNVSGYLQIPMTRPSPGSKLLTDSADNYYDKIVPEIPLGFRRENERRQINEAKTKLTFSFRDVMLKMPILYGLIDMDLRHEQHNQPVNQFRTKEGRFSFNCEVAFDYPMGIAALHFNFLMIDYFGFFAQSGHSWIFWTYTAEENKQKRTASFSVTYRLIRPNEFETIMGPIGFWRPVPQYVKFDGSQFANNRSWAASMSRAMAPRGYSGEIVSPDQDAIIDMCFGIPPQLVESGPGSVDATGPDFPEFLSPPCPEPQNSWLDWDCAIVVSTDDGIVEHRPLPSKAAPDPNQSLTDLIDPFKQKAGFQPVPPQNVPPDGQPPVVLQRTTQPVVYVWLIGSARRVCYDVPPPTLISVGGAVAVPANRSEKEFYSTWLAGNVGVPVLQAVWRLRYILIQTPPGAVGKPVGPLVSDQDQVFSAPDNGQIPPSQGFY